MDKKAELGLLNTALLSMLTGAGGYAGIRGLKDLSNTMSPPTPQSNELNLTLPASRMPSPVKSKTGSDKYAFDEILKDWFHNSNQYFLPAATAAGGLYAGFQGARAINNHVENSALDTEQQTAEQQYLKSLQHARTKMGSVDTPNVDAFINGFLEKDSEYAWGHRLGEIVGEYGSNAMSGINDVGESVGRRIANTPMMGMVGAGAMGLSGATAMATYYLANRLDQNKEEAQRKSNIPTEVKLNVK